MTSTPQVLVVTGASSGIGRSVAVRAAARGWRIALVARGVPALEEAREECLRAGAADAVVISCDVGWADQVEAMFDEVESRLGTPDVVVNSAGVVAYGRSEEIPAEVLDGVIRTNVLGSAHVASRALRIFRPRGRGTLVLLGSVVGYVAVPTMTSYVMSKWAVRALARNLRIENSDVKDVHVIHVAPGGVKTPIYGNAGNYGDREGTPPPPVISADHVAAAIMRAIDKPKEEVQVPITNYPLRLAASVPAVYDRVITPLFRLLAQSKVPVTVPRPGNVLEPIRSPRRGDSTGAREPTTVGG